MDSENLIKAFTSVYGKEKRGVSCYFAPGRVNLIGEHTDYNNGFVLPCALSFGTYLAIRKTEDPVLRFASANSDYSLVVPLAPEYTRQETRWVNYPLGVIRMFQIMGMETGGLEFYYTGNIPPAAGLSSSASIEMGTAYALNDLYGWGMETIDLVHLARKAENEFVGVNCGIMDQFAVGMGKKHHAIFLDCATLEHEAVPLEMPGYRLVIANTNKPRGLADSKYNERVEECNRAVKYLSEAATIDFLGEISWEEFQEIQGHIEDPTILKRARHIVSEDERVLDAITALADGEYEKFGRLMVDSHRSLRDDYEVTGPELDALVEAMLLQEGVLGARMTGAGFGGCTVAFVRHENLDPFMRNVSVHYTNKTGLVADFYLPEIGGGVMKLKE